MRGDFRKASVLPEEEPLLRKAFASGERRPCFMHRPQGDDRNIPLFVAASLDNGRIAVLSLDEVTDAYPRPQKKPPQERRRDYLAEDLCNGFSNYQGLFGRETAHLHSDAGLAHDLDRILNRSAAEEFSGQWENWSASLADGEQSLRIYFQENCRAILEALIAKARTEKIKGDAAGVLLHVHSRMDLCKLCNASLVQMMRVCNHRFMTDERTALKSFLLEQIKSALERASIKLTSDFRFRITVSSRQPYVKPAFVSRRNWCGSDQKSMTRDDPQNPDFAASDYVIHKALFETEGHRRLTIQRNLLPDL